MDLLNHFLQKVWPFQFVNQAKRIKKTAVSYGITGGTTLGTKLKMPIFTLSYPIIYKAEFWCFKSLSNWDTISNRTYQNFRDKRLVRPGSKYPNWQILQPISYKAKFSQSDNIYLVDLRYNITCQNIRKETKVRPIFISWNA